MSTATALLGIPEEAMPAWLALSDALDRLEDEGRSPVCRQHPEQWDAEAKAARREEAAEACTFCPVLQQCGTYADQARECGVWGGIDRTARPTTRKAAA